MQNKANLLDAQMNASYCFTMNYEQITMNNANKNKPKQTQRLSKLLLAFTFLCPSYNLAMQNWTIQKLLNWVTGYLTDKAIDSPRLSAEFLLSDVLGLKRIELYTNFDKPVPQQQLDRLHGLVKRAGQYEPIAYLLGKTEFYCLEFQVSPDCMIPRPETELLVESAIEFLRSRSRKQPAVSLSNPTVCDLCTGSGCIAIAVAKNFANANIIATDISNTALNLAAENLAAHNLKGRVQLLCGDLFDPIIAVPLSDKFDLIVCNPPYVSDAEYEKLGENVRNYEPRMALYGGSDGLEVYRRIAERIDNFLKPRAVLMLEIGYAQGQAVRELLEKANCFAEITIGKDLHNQDRIAIAKK